MFPPLLILGWHHNWFGYNQEFINSFMIPLWGWKPGGHHSPPIRDYVICARPLKSVPGYDTVGYSFRSYLTFTVTLNMGLNWMKICKNLLFSLLLDGETIVLGMIWSCGRLGPLACSNMATSKYCSALESSGSYGNRQRKLLKFGKIDGVKFLAWKFGGVNFLTNSMSGNRCNSNVIYILAPTKNDNEKEITS